MHRLKVMILANDTTYTYNLRNEVIEGLAGRNYEVVIVSQPLLLQDELKNLGCRLIDIETDRHGTNPLSDVSLLLKYVKILRREKPDLVLTYNIKPNVYGGMACKLLKIHCMPNITGLGTAVENSGPIQNITLLLYKAGVAGADCIFFQNEANQSFFHAHRLLGKKQHTRLLPGSGVSLKMHQPLPYHNDGTVHFLFIARIMKEKGIDLYLNAAKAICARHSDVRFHICGYCDDEKYIELLKDAEKNGYITYHGEQKDMVPFFDMANCIVHPSYYPEGMSNVLLEAAAHCRPIITTNRPGCRETVDDKVSGYVIPVRNGKALVKAIEKFLSLSFEQRRDMGLAGRRKVEKEFDRQLVASAYLEEIDRVFKGNQNA